VLFTIALLWLLPWYWRDAFAGRYVGSPDSLGAAFQIAARELVDFGVASLVIILLGLIITWKGYVNHERWAWFVLFIIVWVWAFPLLVLPLLTHKMGYTFTELLNSGIYQRGIPRIAAESVLIFAVGHPRPDGDASRA
jgi:hypothetical protein